MKTGTIKKSINWEELLGANPILKNRKEIWFVNELDNEISLTQITRVKIKDREYSINYYSSYEVEELQIKDNRAILILELKYDKKKKKGLKKVNYNFTEVICYFLVTFFEERLEKDQDFQAVMKELDKY